MNIINVRLALHLFIFVLFTTHTNMYSYYLLLTTDEWPLVFHMRRCFECVWVIVSLTQSLLFLFTIKTVSL